MSYSLNNIPPPFPYTDTTSWTGANFVANGGGNWTQYEWIVILGAFTAFAMAWSIGANDVANSFGTTVGARTVTLWQACIIAAIFEFVGAVSLGGSVAKTVAGGIANSATFVDVPELFAFGMLCTLVVAATAVTIATYLEFAISTTHSIIGCILGFAMVYGGPNAVIWNEKKDDFPYVSGLVPVVLSWFVSPICAAILGSIIFLLCRTFILRSDQAVVRAFIALPILVGITVFINLFFVLYKGAKNELAWDANHAAWVAGAATAGAVALAIPGALLLRRKHNIAMQAADEPPAPIKTVDAEMQAKGLDSPVGDAPEPAPKSMFEKMKRQLTYSLTVDVHEDVHKDARVAAMHANAEVFSPAAEHVFQYLQVFSACAVSFAHGANDVANAVGPFAGIFYVYKNKKVTSSADTPIWILVLGASGIVVGLATYGYNIIKVLGVKMALMTPSRGFSAELATALTISIASVYGLPVSTTQCIVGAEMGVGLSDNIRTGGNWLLFGKTFVGWVVSFVCAALVTAAFFAFCVYAPSKQNLQTVRNYEQAITQSMGVQIVMLNNTNNANNVTLGPQFYNRGLASNISGINANLTALMNYKSNGAPSASNYLFLLKNSTWLYMNQSVPSVGFNGAAATNTSSGIVVPALVAA